MQWRSDMELAPRDGTTIDLWFRDYRRADCRWMAPERPDVRKLPQSAEPQWCYYHSRWGEWVELGDTPTHWARIEGPGERL